MHLNSELLFKKYAKAEFKKGMRVLEVGPTGSPSVYFKLANKKGLTWDTVDLADTKYVAMDNSNLTYKQTKEYTFPIKANNYDVIIAGQVLEHVREVWTWLKEVKRVCKPGGKIIIINPVSWPYHEAPYDCWRIYPEALRALCMQANLKVELCTWESLEKDLMQNFPETPLVPGEAIDYRRDMNSIYRIAKWNKIIHDLPYLKNFVVPVEVSYDAITICQK